MTAYRFRAFSAAALALLLAYAVLAFGAVDTWALMVWEVGVFALAAVWVVRVASGALRPVWNPFYLPWGVAVVWTGAQYVFGLSVHRFRTEAEALKWLALWLLLAVATHVFADESIQSRFRVGMVWLGFALCVFGLVQHYTAENVIYWWVPVPAGKVFGPFVNGNHFTALMELILPAALVLALEPSEQRVLYVVGSSLILTAIVVCASRAGTALAVLETVVVLAVTVLFPGRRRSHGRSRRVLLPVIGVAAAAALSLSVGTRTLLERFQDEQPYSLRWSVARATWSLFLSRPWTGYGAGTFSQVYPSAAPFDLGLFWNHAHNDPIQFAMEWGVVGIGIWGFTLWLLVGRRWPKNAWLISVLPLLTVLAHSWFDFPLQIPAVAAFWMVTLAQLNPAELARARDRRRRAAAVTVDVPAK